LQIHEVTQVFVPALLHLALWLAHQQSTAMDYMTMPSQSLRVGACHQRIDADNHLPAFVALEFQLDQASQLHAF
jgi:hypothetical protein